MRLEFKDFYGQYIDIHNETTSGNIRLRVRTMEDMNVVPMTPVENCEVETDISLNFNQAKLLHTILGIMIDEGVEE